MIAAANGCRATHRSDVPSRRWDHDPRSLETPVKAGRPGRALVWKVGS